jgi:gas vesicle protein
MTAWEFVDSQFFGTVIMAIITLLTGYLFGEKLGREIQESAASENANDVKRKTSAKEENFEKSLESNLKSIESSPLPESENFRKKAKEIVDGTKNYLSSISKKDKDHQRTYEKLSGHRPSELAIALLDRDKITEEQADSAVNMFVLWNQFQRGRVSARPVPGLVYEKLKELQKLVQSPKTT